MEGRNRAFADARTRAMKPLFEAILGSGPTKHAWSPIGQYLAVSGTALRLQIFDRHGVLHDEIPLAGKELKTHAAATHLSWDPRGEKLCMLHREHGKKCAFGADAAMVYHPRQREALKLDNARNDELTHSAWDAEGAARTCRAAWPAAAASRVASGRSAPRAASRATLARSKPLWPRRTGSAPCAERAWTSTRSSRRAPRAERG